MEHFVTSIALIGGVILIASLLSGLIDRSGFPLVSIFLLFGAVLGPWGFGILDIGFQSESLHVLAMLGLTLLLFSDAVTLDIKQLRARKALIWRMVGPGTVVPAIITLLAARMLLGLSWPAAAILGAALASTDPELLRTVVRSRLVPEAPRLALRIETGMNDVVLLPIVLLSMLLLPTASLEASAGPDRLHVGRTLLGLFVLGPVLGAVVGWVGISALVSIRTRVGVRRDYESLYALGLAFTSFALAEAAGGSGFVAAFVAGMLVAAKDVELCDCFFEYGEATAEMLLLLTFVALGTTLIWLGLRSLDWRMLLFAAIALIARPVALYPMLAGLKLERRDRRIIAAFGPRGLSSLLLALLPVFAGVAGSEQIFVLSSVVVLFSVVIHGGGTALFLRRAAPVGPVALDEPLPPLDRGGSSVSGASLQPPLRISIQELKALQSRGGDVVIADARKESAYDSDSVAAAGSVRLSPDDPVRDATALRLSKRANLVVYCA